MGRDWLLVIRLDWRKVAKVTALASPTGGLLTQIVRLQDHYKEVFRETLGTITLFQASLTVTKDAKPKFPKAQPVPLALRAKVESELD